MPKLIQNRPPEGPKSIPGGSKIDPRGLPEGKSHTEFLLGSFFASPGAHLGPPGALLGLSWGSRGAPGSLWGRPGRLQNGSPEASRTGGGSGRPYFRENELPPRREHDFRGSWGIQNGSKIDPKWLQNRSREASGTPTEPGAKLEDPFFAKSAQNTINTMLFGLENISATLRAGENPDRFPPCLLYTSPSPRD